MSYTYMVEVKARSGKLAELVDRFNHDVLPAVQAHPLYEGAEVLVNVGEEIAILLMRTASPCPGALKFSEQELYKLTELIVEPTLPRGFAMHPLGSPLTVAD